MRTLEEIRMTGAAWITEEELTALLDALDFIDEYAWHYRSCAAVDADGDWQRGNASCDCGYDEGRAELAESNWCGRP